MDQVWCRKTQLDIFISYDKLDFEQEDDDFVAGSSTTTAPVVVFAAGTQSEEKHQVDKAAMRAFMVCLLSFSRILLSTPCIVVL